MYDKESSLAIVSSVLFPQPPIEGTLTKRRRLHTLPGAWIDEEDNEEQEVFIQKIPATPPRITTQLLGTNEEDIELLKETIANLKREKEKLEETNDIVKKSIQIVARKRLKAHKHTQMIDHEDDEDNDDELEEFIVISSDLMPTQDELKAAGIDGWEWIAAY
ncbi:hypothetical protein BD560DRAFT_386189 [Blakeslea trispora]|nr:hypothetical protein BD560DRAFT_386189 [Blakeslea trispora]